MFLTFYQAEVTWNSTSKGFDRFLSGYTEKLGQKSSLVAFWGLTAHMGGPSLAHVMLKIFWGGRQGMQKWNNQNMERQYILKKEAMRHLQGQTCSEWALTNHSQIMEVKHREDGHLAEFQRMRMISAMERITRHFCQPVLRQRIEMGLYYFKGQSNAKE